jgi:uncharacterized protein YodC (DUF2158 family)
MTFAPGDIVALKSGGQSMTVVAVDEDEVDCLWLSDAGDLFRQSIPVVALTMLEKSEAEEEAEQDKDEEDDDDERLEDDEDDEEDEEREEKRRAKGR